MIYLRPKVVCVCRNAVPYCYTWAGVSECAGVLCDWLDAGVLAGRRAVACLSQGVRPLAPRLGPQPSAASKRRREYAGQDPGTTT